MDYHPENPEDYLKKEDELEEIKNQMLKALIDIRGYLWW
jgi:hypothetical protein